MSMLKCTLRRMLVAGALGIMSATASHASVVSPRRLLEVADIASPTISPDGHSVAFRVERASVARNTYESVWYVQGLDDAFPRRVGDGGIPLRDSVGQSLSPKVLWSPDGRWIYYRALIDGKVAVWRAAANGSGADPITHDAADVRDFSLGKEGRVLIYSVGATREQVRSAERAEYDHGIHIDASVPVGQPLFRSGYVGGRMATQRYGKVWFDRVPLLAGVPDQWKALDLQKKTTRNLGATDPGNANGSSDAGKRYPHAWRLSFSLRGGQVAILTRIGKRKGLLLKPGIRLSAVLPGRLHESVCEVASCTGKNITSIQWRPRSDEVLFTVTDPLMGEAQSIYRWNVGSGAVFPVAHSVGLLNGGRDYHSKCGVSFTSMVCVDATAGRPPRLERIDLEAGGRKVLFEPNASLARDMAKVPIRLLRWKDAKGQLFTGQLYKAKSRSGVRPPLFVDYYWCAGFVRGGLGDEWPFVSLAEHGISALCINTAPYAVDPIHRFDNGLAAVRSAIKLMSANGEIDASKVGMGGLSFGSEVTLWVAMHSRLLSAVSISSPLVSPLYYLIGSLKGNDFTKSLFKLWGLGAPSKTPERWKALSPALNLESIRAPILIQAPEQEYMLALDYEIPLINEHRADLYVFPNEPHQKFQPRHKLAVYNRNIDWFRFWLQGYEDPDPGKREQYAHWREMRADQCKWLARKGDAAPWYCKAH